MAREQDRPILLSIGYAACHWCHVMAHESFEDENTARMMNENFVNIKLDREERPDIDHIYQVAHQLMTRRSGGWPLTVFMDPKQVPFFIGTYFPLQEGRGMSSFLQVLMAMSDIWANRRKDIDRQGQSVCQALEGMEQGGVGAGKTLDSDLVARGLERIRRNIDPIKGGFQSAPKFAHPTAMEFCLSQAISEKNDKLLKEITNTLTIMGRSGLFDHVGGGFFRYCVDEDWQIPHFEKMLYDNGLLLNLYALAYEATGDTHYREWIEMTAAWAIREMQSPDGGFFSSLDADSEGREGSFYVWNADEIKSVLNSEEFELASALFRLDLEPNFEGRRHLTVTGKEPVMGMDAFCSDKARSVRNKLLQARAKRTRPGCDDKVLTAWNALMVKGLHRAGRVLGDPELEKNALYSLGFIRERMWDGSRLLAVHRNGTSYQNGYVNDYAYLLDALLEVRKGKTPPDYLDGMAVDVAKALITDFEDRERGGFFFTSHEHEKLLIRFRTAMDDVMPSGNSVAAAALASIGAEMQEQSFTKAASDCLDSFAGNMEDYPQGMAGMLMALSKRDTA